MLLAARELFPDKSSLDRPAALVAGVPTGVPQFHIGPRGPTISDIGAGGGGAVEVQAVGLVFHNAEGDRWLVIT